MSPVAEIARLHTTSSAVTLPGPQVAYLGAVSMRPADPILDAPEDAIDYDAGAAAFLAAPEVEDYTSSPVSTGSPFGI